MADRTISERLQPSLLDRLTDEDPARTSESRDQRVIDIKRLREIVQRDLSWLLNTNNAEPWIDPERHPHAARSVLNYGIIDLSGVFATRSRNDAIRASLRRSIELFEPRLRPGSLVIELTTAKAGRDVVLAFDIRADMWAEPVPLELYLRSEIDVTTGTVEIERIG
jgi:type VI secretion system protein ImpF